jgi:hypothetical protein
MSMRSRVPPPRLRVRASAKYQRSPTLNNRLGLLVRGIRRRFLGASHRRLSAPAGPPAVAVRSSISDLMLCRANGRVVARAMMLRSTTTLKVCSIALAKQQRRSANARLCSPARGAGL